MVREGRDGVLGEGEGPACKGVETRQTRSFILHVPEWVSQLLKAF